MFRNYLKIALRHLFREKVFSLINITGLAIGFACTALIFLWVGDELSFDDFHKNKDRIYRVLVKANGVNSNGINRTMAVTPGKLAGAIKNEIPEVRFVSRNNKGFRTPFKYKENNFYENNVYSVDSDFFKMFSFNIIKGNNVQPFNNMNDIVISERIALKYFGKEDPIGKTLISNNKHEYTVSAVIANMPSNSHMQMDILQSHMGAEKYWKSGYSWGNYVHETYLMTNNNTEPEIIAKKIETLLNKNNRIEKLHFSVTLQPLSDIYLNPDIANSNGLSSDRKYVNIFSIIALGILLIACINFINISTANSISRSKEIGIRKVLGSKKQNLIIQFMGEFSILTFIAALFSIILLLFVLPYFNHFTGKELVPDRIFFFIFSAIVVLTGLIGGTYPALYVSSFTPGRVLKNKFSGKRKGFSPRSALVIFQFSISILLIISTIYVNNQLSFIQNKNLGFEKNKVLYIPATGDLAKKFKSAKSRFLQYPNIKNVSMNECPPLNNLSGGFITWDEHKEEDIIVRAMQVTPDYFKTLNIKSTAGRLFSQKLSTDKNTFILNEAAVKFSGIQSPVGKRIKALGREGKIIGIVNNTHFKSLHHQIDPLIFMPLSSNRYGYLHYTAGSILIGFSGNDIPTVLSNIKSVWQAYNHGLPFEYHFLDKTIEQKYGFEQRLSKIFNWFSLLAIFISCLGLFALITFVALKKTKEVGIRKVLGASVPKIVIMLSKDFIIWTLIANIIAWPIAWYAINKWLQGFAYRVDMTISPFILSGVLALTIALLTVSFQAVKSATANPVDSLNYE